MINVSIFVSQHRQNRLTLSTIFVRGFLLGNGRRRRANGFIDTVDEDAGRSIFNGVLYYIMRKLFLKDVPAWRIRKNVDRRSSCHKNRSNDSHPRISRTADLLLRRIEEVPLHDD